MSRQEWISPEGYRLDGRRAEEVRRLNANIGVLPGVDGSAFLELGNTKILATVHGPSEPKLRSNIYFDRVFINCEYSVATFSTTERRRQSKGDRQTSDISSVMKQAFEAAIITSLYPRSQIDIFVHVLQSDGGDIAACLNAGTLALIDAGLALRDCMVAVTAGYIDGTPLLDLNYMERVAHTPELVVAVLPRTKKVILCQMEGKSHVDAFESILKLAVRGAVAISSELREEIISRTRERAFIRN